MRTIGRTDFRSALRRAYPSPVPPPAADFWNRFRARLAQLPAARPAAPTRVWRPLVASAAMAACGVALLAILPLSWPSAGAAPSPLSRVEDLSVYGDYSSIFIIEDRVNQGTIVWVADWTRPAAEPRPEAPPL
ncbi:MAG: hypothetical protein BWZ02_00558 [Lentisphaerae bacterium ADurb.BinA184]|nr:MAG: hypothetical protein BWZ02_00558 [Lentisphaerae bacterium ADurb.BinA184]